MPAGGGTRVRSDGKLHIGRVLAPIRLLFLEMFSCTKRLTVAVSQFAHIEVSSWDIVEGTEYNLLQWPTVKRLLRILESPYIIGVWYGTPCNTMTIARRPGRPGPPTVRSASYPEGLPHLTGAVLRSVQDVNHFAQVIAVEIEVCHASGGYSVVENPWKSYLWQQPRLIAAFD